MVKLNKKIATIFYIIMIASKLQAQQIDCNLELPKTITSDRILILFDNGIGQEFVDFNVIDFRVDIKKKVFSEFGMINVLYRNSKGNFDGVRFLVKANVKSSILFKQVNDTTLNLLSKSFTENAFDISKHKDFLAIKKYCKAEFDENTFYSKEYRNQKSDLNLNLYNLSSIKLARKELSYIKKNGNKYFYFWYFRVNVVATLLKTNKIEIYETFNSVFPKKFTESDEGKSLKEKIEGNLYVKEGEKAPLFRTIGYYGDSIILEKFRGKYVLIDFWATWCIPCIEKIPTIKKIRNDFDRKILEIVSISYDKDSIAFINGVKKYELNWFNIFNNPKIRNAYGDTPIPALYLIDPNGIICYSSWENNIDKLFDILKKTIK
jgi:thiol-disulfide isomerase/thioredoxin